MHLQNFREGEFLESVEGLIFDVKGLTHPPDRIIAFVRYIPDTQGDRNRRGVRYRKIYDLNERFRFLRNNYPEYLVHDAVFDELLQEVPIEKIVQHYKPLEKTQILRRSINKRPLEVKSLEMIEEISRESRIPSSCFGISGSILVDLSDTNSDLDIVVYGSNRCQTVRESLRKLLNKNQDFQQYKTSAIRAMYETRHAETGVPFITYAYSEARKDFQGQFRGIDFFVRYVKDWPEIEENYGTTLYEQAGYGEVETMIESDIESMFTPCSYTLSHTKVVEGPKTATITEITSFRGQFCEQAKAGERVRARGKIEKRIIDHHVDYRLILGNTKKDFMIVLDT